MVKRIGAPQPMNGHAEQLEEAEVVGEAEVEEFEAGDETPAAAKKRVRRAAPKPQLINDLDLQSEPPLSSLGTFKSHLKRYLAIAAWLHDHRNIEVIDERYIYTCYRHLNWPTDVSDFAQPLRALKHKQFFESPEVGKYAINQLGLQKAKEASGG